MINTSIFNTVLYFVSFVYFYNIFLFLPDHNFGLFNLSLKSVYLVFTQGIFLCLLVSNKIQSSKIFAFLFFLTILPSYLVDVKLCLFQVIVVWVWSFLGIDEESKFAGILFFFLWFIFNFLFLRIVFG